MLPVPEGGPLGQNVPSATTASIPESPEPTEDHEGIEEDEGENADGISGRGGLPLHHPMGCAIEILPGGRIA